MATVPGQGWLGYVQFDIEVTPGTAIAAAKRLAVTKYRPGIAITPIESKTLDGTLDLNFIAQGKTLFPFSFSMEWQYTGGERLLKWMYGANSTSGADPYTHVATGGATPLSATFEFLDGISGGKSFRYAGAYCKSAKWSVKSGDILTVDITGVATATTAEFTPTGALSAPTFNPVLAGHVSALVDGAGVAVSSARFKQFDLSFDQPLDEDRTFLSSFNVDLPLPNAKRKTVYDITQEYLAGGAAYSAVSSATNAAPAITFTNGIYIFKLESPNSLPATYDVGPEGFGIITGKTNVQAYGNGTFQIKATSTNHTTAI